MYMTSNAFNALHAISLRSDLISGKGEAGVLDLD